MELELPIGSGLGAARARRLPLPCNGRGHHDLRGKLVSSGKIVLFSSWQQSMILACLMRYVFTWHAPVQT